MSNPDSFIDEVNEELKRDRLFGLFRKYGWILVVAVLAVVGWASWNEWSRAQDRARAQAFGDSVIAALDLDQGQARIAALQALAAQHRTGSGGSGRAGVVGLLLAAEALAEGDRPAALTALAAVADDTAMPTSYRQLATLKRVILAGDAISLADRRAALAPLAQAGQPLRPLALEQLALLRLEGGDADGALSDLRNLLREPDLSQELRGRVIQMIVVLGGDPSGDLG